MKSFFFPLLILLVSCQGVSQNTKFISKESQASYPITLVDTTGKTISTRFMTPKGFDREKTKSNTFANYLQNFPLKPYNTKVYYYNKQEKPNQSVHAAVLDIDVGKRDLQQCADAVMRLRAEYLFRQERYDDIHFNFTNGFNAVYSKWRQGYRIQVKGNYVKWIKTNQESISYKSFRNYLVMVFSYAGTLSLEKELNTTTLKNLQIGNVFIHGGSPGHAVIIVDLCTDKVGNKCFLLAQSYMPAQDVHVLENWHDVTNSPWYKAENLIDLKTPEWHFKVTELQRF